MRQTLIATVENKPGVLNRVASLFRRRNFNIDSLNVGRTELSEVSRMTIVVDSRDTEARLVEANLYKLVNVIDVQDVTDQPAVFRELALIKVAAEPEKRTEIISLANVFKAKIVDVGAESLIMQITASEDRVDSLIELLRPHGIIEIVRTGHMAMMRGTAHGVRHTPGSHSTCKSITIALETLSRPLAGGRRQKGAGQAGRQERRPRIVGGEAQCIINALSGRKKPCFGFRAAYAHHVGIGHRDHSLIGADVRDQSAR